MKDSLDILARPSKPARLTVDCVVCSIWLSLACRVQQLPTTNLHISASDFYSVDILELSAADDVKFADLCCRREALPEQWDRVVANEVSMAK